MSQAENLTDATFEETSNQEETPAAPVTQSIEVRGDVKAPGEFSFEDAADIFHYIELAGGALTDPKLCNLVVVRQYGSQKRSLVFRLDQKEYLPRIKQGDVIIITGLGEDKVAQRKYRKPSIAAPKSQDLLRPQVADYEKALPSSGVALKRAVDDYIKFPQFKRLLSQIAAHQAATGMKSYAVLSHNAGEGKSFFCAALSLAYARFLDSQVLLIDSTRDENSRSPLLAVVKGDYSAQVPDRELHIEPSFVDLVNVSEIEKDYHENSDFYFGPYINSVKSRYDIVLVDTSAVSSVSKDAVDPMIIASQVDGVIVINSPASLDKKLLEKFMQELKSNGAKIVGTVFNSFVRK